MPERSIARVDDPAVREALLDVQAQIYRELKNTNQALASVANATAAANAAIDKHAGICLEERLADKQWRDSVARSVQRMQVVFEKHCDKDDAIQGRISETLNAMAVTAASQRGAVSGSLKTIGVLVGIVTAGSSALTLLVSWATHLH